MREYSHYPQFRIWPLVRPFLGLRNVCLSLGVGELVPQLRFSLIECSDVALWSSPGLGKYLISPGGDGSFVLLVKNLASSPDCLQPIG